MVYMNNGPKRLQNHVPIHSSSTFTLQKTKYHRISRYYTTRGHSWLLVKCRMRRKTSYKNQTYRVDKSRGKSVSIAKRFLFYSHHIIEKRNNNIKLFCVGADRIRFACVFVFDAFNSFFCLFDF